MQQFWPELAMVFGVKLPLRPEISMGLDFKLPVKVTYENTVSVFGTLKEKNIVIAIV